MFDTIRTQAMRRTRRAGALRTGIRAADRRPGPVTVYGPGAVPAVPMVAIDCPRAPVTRDSFAGWEAEDYYLPRRGGPGQE